MADREQPQPVTAKPQGQHLGDLAKLAAEFADMATAATHALHARTLGGPFEASAEAALQQAQATAGHLHRMAKALSPAGRKQPS